MLRTLSIRNILLIESLDLNFGSGLGVLTGETGSGKSILLDALSLAIGVRADIGLADITNNDTDISRAELSENNTYIYRDDKDTHFGVQGSFGFRF